MIKLRENKTINKILILSVLLSVLALPVAAVGNGDVNGDGGTNIVDAFLIAAYTVITQGNLPIALFTEGDVNGDGIITIADALLIAQYTVGTQTITGAIPLISPIAANPDPVSVGNLVLAPGSTGTVAIKVNSVTFDIATATVRLSFNPANVTVISVGAGDLGAPTSNINNIAGTVDISVFTTHPAITSPVTLATVTLQAGSAQGASPLTLTVIELSDANGVNRVPGESGITNGVVTIGNGDVNGDGQVTIVDALFIAQYTVGTRTLTFTQFAAADVNGDGQVTVADALFIAQYTVGLRQL